AYSLVSTARTVAPLMTEGGSVITLSYLGATRVVTNYNVMGVAKAALEACVRYLSSDLGPSNIRVNAISAGAVASQLHARGSGRYGSFSGQRPGPRRDRQRVVRRCRLSGNGILARCL